MASYLIAVLWTFLMAALTALFITRAKLIFRLRENYPNLYSNIGRPAGFSRSIEFLWQLRPYQSELSARDLKLLRLNLALFYTGAATTVLFVACLLFD
jgi:hypothetical protein